jgi:hypothetical protein
MKLNAVKNGIVLFNLEGGLIKQSPYLRKNA